MKKTVQIEILDRREIPPRAHRLTKWKDALATLTLANTIKVFTVNDCNSVQTQAKRHGMKVTRRKDDHGKGYLIWRIE